MATIDRLEPAYTVWSPTTSGFTTEDEDYVGRHRAPYARRWWTMSVSRLFYLARHRRR